jgi:hypothetical protein
MLTLKSGVGGSDVEISTSSYGYGLPSDLGEVWSDTNGNDTYSYIKGAVKVDFEDLSFVNLSKAKALEVVAFLVEHRAGVSFTFVDHDETEYTVINRTKRPKPVHVGLQRWKLTLHFEVL